MKGSRGVLVALRDRLFTVRIGGRFRLSVALGIVLMSILAAIMAWRASVWDERSANTDELSRQDIVQQQQIEASHSETVNQDLRVFGRYEENSLLARELERDARGMRGADPLLAQQLTIEAQGLRAQAKSLRPFFRASQPLDNDDGTVYFDPAFARQVLRQDDPELESLKPNELREQAKDAHVKAVRLTGLAALFIAALFFLTLAEATRQGMSRGFALTGVIVASIALILFVLV